MAEKKMLKGLTELKCETKSQKIYTVKMEILKQLNKNEKKSRQMRDRPTGGKDTREEIEVIDREQLCL